MTTKTTYPDVPVPDGTTTDTWEDGCRPILGQRRGIDGYDIEFWTGAAQFTDGSIDV
ncbi:MAG: hypothetical protein QOH60_606 [Mycobacterium sp.]|jgi:hypothetical protein|nr:hypothetical protein [Mycobacterium sp.]